MECNNHSYFRLQFDVHNQKILYRKNSTPWPWAYFTNGPNAAASIAPTLIRHCRRRCAAAAAAAATAAFRCRRGHLRRHHCWCCV